MYLQGWFGRSGRILITNQRVVFVGYYLILGLIFNLLLPRTEIDVNLLYSKISNISIGKYIRSETVDITGVEYDNKSKKYTFLIANHEDWIAQVQQYLNSNESLDKS